MEFSYDFQQSSRVAVCAETSGQRGNDVISVYLSAAVLGLTPDRAS